MDTETVKQAGIPPEYLHQLSNGSYVHRGMFNTFGPSANCTIDLCPIEWSLFRYRPSLAANSVFLALFGLALLVHVYLGIRWRTWGFLTFMVFGCSSVMLGYGGRIMLWINPWSFAGFMLQIILVGSGPVWFSAAIYVTLSRAIRFLSPEIARLPPKVFYWLFICSDFICLILQAIGGALSTTSKGVSQTGVDLARAGLIIQVIVLIIFCGFFADHLIRFHMLRKSKPGELETPFGIRQKMFFGGLASAVILILARCAYRVEELSEGYSNSSKLADEGLFIGLEGVLIIVAVICLFFGHPGVGFGGLEDRTKHSEESSVEK
ncbi:unnamed protein product [Clonostachys solani]|uniref:Uncharacterized protein n=1 Tax=Clonostachys solani TaxID=160281 RepID=A0A9P0EEL7_9HYPO|nr:unnamed protein product [Clonostachys solani]